jgi:hypothetical protein
MRNPVSEDGGPLFAYTAMPTGWINSWFSRDLNDRIEMGRYLGHTYNMPLYKIPEKGKVPVPVPGQPSYLARHELFTLPNPPDVLAVEDSKVEARLMRRIVEHLQRLGAPSDHLARLGLSGINS